MASFADMFAIGDCRRTSLSKKPFERHSQPWTADEIAKLRTLAGKGMALKAIAKALSRSEESARDRARKDGISIAKLH
jgi:hypothetical protein